MSILPKQKDFRMKDPPDVDIDDPMEVFREEVEKELRRESYELSQLLDMELDELIELAESMSLSTIGSKRDIARRILKTQASQSNVIDLGKINLELIEREDDAS